ncbi:hypothetical protein BGZ79_001553, partial [Entomortierella chlamydospora]
DKYTPGLVANSGTWERLDDVGRKNSDCVPKKHIHDVIAHKVNTESSTDEMPLSLDDQNIRKRIETMKK